MQSKELDQKRMGTMVEVARFESPVEAQIAKGMLESAGIECELAGENANQLIQAAFEVQLEVWAKDENVARDLLNSAGEKTGMILPDIDAEPQQG